MLKFQRVEDEKRGCWNDVILFGQKVAEQSEGVKIPMSAYGGTLWSWGGRRWSWKVGNQWINVYNPASVVLSTFEPQIEEVHYAIKSFFSVLSGFDRLESRNGERWEAADESWDDSYYVCARFSNGRHIPLPILADWNEDEHRLQKFAIRLAGKLNRKSFEIARNRCEDWVEPA